MSFLTIVPTPIDDYHILPEKTREILLQAVEEEQLILVEELKACRRRWIHYGLPREAIDNFILYNEHTRDELNDQMIAELKSGKQVYLLSDCGLPAFCDPGMSLIDRCHRNKIRVTATQFSNSVVLALALSGFSHKKFRFEGFLSAKNDERKRELQKIIKSPGTCIIMDTPYRLKKILEDLADLNCGREIFVAMDLNAPEEELVRGNIKTVMKKIDNYKREFILIFG